MSQRNTTSVHSGNYYSVGVQRVLAKLASMGVAIPEAALKVPPHEGRFKPLAEFTRIEHAMLDWFEGRDYDQAQALIHYRPPCDQWHVIHILNEEKTPQDVSHEMLCPTKADALAAVLSGCDRATVGLDACRKDGDALVVVIDGADAIRIEPVVMEPFNLSVRDRVRTAFKGVRHYDTAIFSHAGRLPGFKAILVSPDAMIGGPPRGCMFLGFPGNWALAMRNALKQVGIIVKQSQAQELAAVFFGASDWHQLVKHQDDMNGAVPPVAVAVVGADGQQCRFYRTPEEAFFASGQAVANYPEPVVTRHIGLSLDNHRIYFSAATQGAMQVAAQKDLIVCPTCIDTGYNDYWDVDGYGTDAIADAVRQILATLDGNDGAETTHGMLYDDATPAELLEGSLKRDGIPADQIVYIGDHALAVSYVPEPNGSSMMAAHLQVFQMTEQGPRKLRNGDVAMYKAEMYVLDAPDSATLVIKPDYGHDEPIEIRAEHRDQIERLIALTHKDDLFSLGRIFRVRAGQPMDMSQS